MHATKVRTIGKALAVLVALPVALLLSTVLSQAAIIESDLESFYFAGQSLAGESKGVLTFDTSTGKGSYVGDWTSTGGYMAGLFGTGTLTFSVDFGQPIDPYQVLASSSSVWGDMSLPPGSHFVYDLDLAGQHGFSHAVRQNEMGMVYSYQNVTVWNLWTAYQTYRIGSGGGFTAPYGDSLFKVTGTRVIGPPPSNVPEPGTMVGMGIGLVLVAGLSRKRTS